MTHKKSGFVILLGLVFVLSVFSYLVWQKEQLLKTGERALIKLAPVDPRSLIQGDYMRLNYVLPPTISTLAREQNEGVIIYTLDSQQVITLLRVAGDNEVLHKGEKLIRFRYRKKHLQLGANSFMFQEGKAKIFEQATFSEVRIDKSGNVILVGLRDKNYQLLGMTSGLK